MYMYSSWLSYYVYLRNYVLVHRKLLGRTQPLQMLQVGWMVYKAHLYIIFVRVNVNNASKAKEEEASESNCGDVYVSSRKVKFR